MTKIRYSMFLFFVLSIIFLYGGTTLGATFPVSTTQQLRQALLDAAGNGAADTILLADGTYATTDDGGGTFIFSDSQNYDLTIRGSSPKGVILSGEDTDQVLSFNSTTSTATIHLENISIVNGSTLENGGGIHAEDLYSVSMTNCRISGNMAGISGGGFYGLGSLIVANSTIENNSAGSYGGGFYGAGILTVMNSTITGNVAGTGGGGFYTMEGPSGAKSATVKNSTISGNTAGGYGGGVYADGSSDRTTAVTNSILSDNTATSGGAGFFINGTVTAINSIYIRNIPSEAIYLNEGTSNYVLNSIFVDNGNYDVAGAPDAIATIYNNYIDESKIDMDASTNENIFGGNLDFADQTTGDFHIGPASILIDEGTTSIPGITFPDGDFDGNLRVVGVSIDIGPYEFSATRPIIDSFTYSGFPEVLSEITFTIAATPHTGRTIETYEIDFGDGIFMPADVVTTHVYTVAGDYTVTARVTDSSGEFTLETLDLYIIPLDEISLLDKVADALQNNDPEAIKDAIDALFASGLPPDALAQALSEAFGVGLALVAQLEEDIARWDVDGDGKISLADSIHGLQVLSGE